MRRISASFCVVALIHSILPIGALAETPSTWGRIKSLYAPGQLVNAELYRDPSVSETEARLVLGLVRDYDANAIQSEDWRGVFECRHTEGGRVQRDYILVLVSRSGSASTYGISSSMHRVFGVAHYNPLSGVYFSGDEEGFNPVTPLSHTGDLQPESLWDAFCGAAAGAAANKITASIPYPIVRGIAWALVFATAYALCSGMLHFGDGTYVPPTPPGTPVRWNKPGH